MTSTQQKIQDAAARNAELLEGLHETDSAPSQLHQQIQYLNDLAAQLQKTEKHVRYLKTATASELKDHKKYSESTFRRFAHKASGRKDRFEEKAAKEEREYFDAIQQQKTGEDDLAYVRQLKAEGETTKAQYEAQVKRHEELQRELDALYNSIFAGHTPDFPEEDEKEYSCNALNQHVQDINSTLEKERHILFLLRQISIKLSEARKHLDSAHSMSQMDLFGGGTMASMQKRNYLERAESSISQARMLQDQLSQVAPQMGDLGPMNIASGSIWGDIVFDNIFSDFEMHDKIKNSEAQIDRAGNKCGNLVKQQEGREKELVAELNEAGMRLKEARATLQRVREQAFRRVIAGRPLSSGGDVEEGMVEGTAEAPPVYSA
jgi:hypothetical protein